MIDILNKIIEITKDKDSRLIYDFRPHMVHIQISWIQYNNIYKIQETISRELYEQSQANSMVQELILSKTLDRIKYEVGKIDYEF